VEQLTSLVSSRGLLKRCRHFNRQPLSSSKQLDIDLLDGLANGQTIYVCTDALSLFVRNLLPNITVQFVLVTGDSDLAIDQGFLATNESQWLLNHPLLKKWFAQNLVVNHERLDHLPIGLDYHTQWEKPGLWSIGKISPMAQESHLLEALARSPHFQDRYCRAYCNWQFAAKHGDRMQCFNEVDKSCCFFESTKLPRKLSWSRQAEFMFCLSPSGIGVDCHRTWEALALGMVPIVKQSGLTRLFGNLPVLAVDSWASVNQSFLNQAAQMMNKSRFDFSPLFTHHWVNRFSGIEEKLFEYMTIREFRELMVTWQS
jgi:hypothetical protein